MSWVVRPWELDDTDGIIAVQHQCAPMHKVSKAEFLKDLEGLEPDLQRMIFVAEADKKIVGIVIANRNAGMYHPNKFMLELGVLAANRNQGIGTALYDMARSHLGELGVISITVQVSEQNERGLAFAAARGYDEQKRDFVSVLDLAHFDPTLFNVEDPNIEIKSFEELDSPEMRQEWFELFSVVRQDVPRSAPPTPLTFEFFQDNVIDEPDLVRSASLFAFHNGRMIGFTAGFHDRESNHFDQWLTAVNREHRGKHVALALKVAQATEAKRLGIASIKTDNDTRNTAMLKVNERLGFVRQPAVLSLAKDFWGCQG